MDPTYALGAVASVAAVAVILIGAAPMAAASLNPHADPLITDAIDGPPNQVSFAAPALHLVNQRHQPVTLATLRGKAVALTFLDPVCTADCPVIAQEFRAADAMLGSAAGRVDFVAVVANPIYRQAVYTRAFDRQEGLTGVRNWLFLTGSVAQLEQVWNDYGVQVSVEPRGRWSPTAI